MQLSKNPCLVKNCPGLAVPKSVFRYCAIHEMVATDADHFNLALKGRLTPLLKEFALDVERGIYPRIPL